jgi:peptidoglycan/LPS O-acetylase OafA/YrhL
MIGSPSEAGHGAHQTQGRNPALDTLRAIAILLVVAGHILPPPSVRAGWHDLIDLGGRGVDLFFVLSGYLIGGIAIREIERRGRLDLGEFWKRRWFRTLPAYYVTLGLYAAKQLLPHKSGGLVSPGSYLFFWQIYAVKPLQDFGHSWSLCVEEHFYLVLPVLLLVFSRWRHRAADVLGLMVFIGLGMMLLRSGLTLAGWETFDRLSIWRTDGLCVGVALAAWEQMDPARARATVARQARVIAVLSALLIAIGCALQLTQSRFHQPFFAFGFGGVVALGFARHEALAAPGRRAFVALTAKISYSMYLLHPLVMSTLVTVGFLRRGPVVAAAYFVLAVGLTYLSAWISYRIVEQPFLKLRDRIGRPARLAPTSSPTSERVGGQRAQIGGGG